MAGAGRDHPGRARPDAVLRRVRRPGRRRRRPHLGRRPRGGARRPAAGQGPGRPPGPGPRGRAARGRRARGRGRLRVAAVGAARRTRAPTSCTRRCARCSARRRCSPARTTGPATCGWTSPGRARSPSSSAPTSRTSPTPPSAPTTGSPRAYMSLPEAQAFGALALFGETYGEQVRVVEIGGPWSRELCGGTHVRGSAQIGTLALTGESSVGSGLAPRRGGRRAGGLPLPGPRARPGPPARRAAQDAAGRPRRAGQRHARPAP